MASKGWSLLMVMVSALAVVLTVSLLCLHPKPLVRLSPQGSAEIALPLHALDHLYASKPDPLVAIPLLSLSPTGASNTKQVHNARYRMRAAMLHASGHKPSTDAWDGIASGPCRYDS